MGGYNSGRWGGRPTVEAGLTVSLPMVMGRGWVRDGDAGHGSLHWSRNGERFASIGHSFDMREPESAWLKLSYTWAPAGGEARRVEQHIQLTYTVPHYGGRRWWMLCPFTGRRVAKLHLPPGGGKFGSREAWRLGYRSQRIAHRDRPFEKLFRLQCKLASHEGFEAGLIRPKGMWRRTYERHWERYLDLEEICAAEMMGVLGRLRLRAKGRAVE